MRTGAFALKSLLLGSVAAATIGVYASAQDASDAEEASTREIIIVTATKREESIQTVGLSISAVSGAELQERGVVDFEDYAISIPNLAFGATDDGVLANRTISIRGIEGINTTGFYIDDVPLSETVDPLVLDVERVEVLRGPQGTLYGARGLGGTVRVITKQPEFDSFNGRARGGVSYTEEGGFNYIVDGSVNIPVSDTLAFRATAYLQELEGVFDREVGPIVSPGLSGAGGLVGDPATSEENVDDRTTYGAQFALRWAPNDALDVTARVLAQKIELDGFPLADNAFDPASPPANFALSADDYTQDRLFNVAEGAEDQWVQASLTANYETSYGTFTSSSAYFERNTNDFEDSSEFISFTLLGGILPGAGLPTAATPVRSPIFQELDFRTIVQEARFVSDFDGPFQLTTGLFYQFTDDDEAFNPPNIAPGFDAVFSTQLNGGVPATGFSGFDDLIFTSDTSFEVEEIGVYGEGSYDVTDRLSVVLGARFYDTETTFEDFQTGFAVGSTAVVPSTTQSEDGVKFRGVVEFEATDNVYLYTSVAEGFRIGGVNGPLPDGLGCQDQVRELGVDPDDAISFDSDELISYEAGAKTTWDGGRFTANAAAFYIDFDDIQQRILPACGFQFTANIGAARSQGFEVETSWQATDALELEFAAGYTDAEFTETIEGLVEDGDPLQQIPEWTAAASFDYSFPLMQTKEGFVRGDYAYVGESISRVVSSSNPRTRPSYDIVNARLGLRATEWEFSLFVDNALDEEAVFADNRTLAAEAFGRPRVVRNRPRTIGIDVRTSF